MEKIHIVTATNDDFARHMAVMLFSLLENAKSGNPIIIYVLEGDLSLTHKQKLKTIISRYNAEIQFIHIRDTAFNDVLISGHVSKETYFRINIPNLLNKDLSKVLYLDSDMIIHDDIARLWETNLNGFYLAAVEDLAGYYRYEDLSIPEHRYFNAGVLLIDLQKWREDSIPEKVMHFLHDNPHKIWWWDQDALNAILYDKWLPLDMKWNYQPFSRAPFPYPSIIHFTSQIKPWNGNPPLKQYYYWYAHRLNY